MQLLFYQRAPCPAPLLHQLYRKSCLSCRIEPRRHQWKSCWTRRDKQFLYDKQEQRCLGCLRNFRFNDLTVDHIWAVRWGGADEIKNWQLLCRRCNSTKGARGMAYLRRAPPGQRCACRHIPG